jgi:uncharacterized membrane protein
MEKIIVLVFDSEKNAHEGIRALKRLDSESSISINAGALIRKKSDGTFETVKTGEFPEGTLVGTASGALLGVIAGPAGVAAGASVGALGGMLGDTWVGTVDQEFLDELTPKLKAGTDTVVLDVDEEWVTPIDTDLRPLAKHIYRRSVVDVEDELTSRRVNMENKEIEALGKEGARAQGEAKARIEKQIDELKSRIKRQVARFEEKRAKVHEASKAKIQALEEKASKSAGESKTKILSQVEALRKADLEFTERVDKGVAARLRKAAEYFERKAG